MAKQYQYNKNLNFILNIEDEIVDVETDELCKELGFDIAEIHRLREKESEDYVLKCDGTW